MKHRNPYAQSVESSTDSNLKEGGDSNSPTSSCQINTNDKNQPNNSLPFLDIPQEDLLRIMQKVLPPHAEITNKATETIQQCVYRFITTLTSEANKHCKSEKRKVVAAKDLLSAMEGLGLDNYVEPLLAYHDSYLENEVKQLIMGGNNGNKRVENDVMGLITPQLQESSGGSNSIPVTPNFNPTSVSSSASCNAVENFGLLPFLDP
ncbi:unnamed protein product [Lupinus luteus]|uniref:Transcription factor CBF/NF-Y/archaeal histone domain-containing protein n=1 Tax=Lupinus luteus TaxID=3873 RepID=A0AAV1WEZ1_LUPLU